MDYCWVVDGRCCGLLLGHGGAVLWTIVGSWTGGVVDYCWVMEGRCCGLLLGHGRAVLWTIVGSWTGGVVGAGIT